MDEAEKQSVEVEGLSYETRQYIENLRHPRQVIEGERVRFRCCSTKIGRFSLSGNEKTITEAEEELGIGMTIYFRQMKFFALIFTILTLISVPSFILFSLGKSPSGQGLWFNLSLGNLGYEDLACSYSKVQESELVEINLECSVGIISAMLEFGLSTKESVCPTSGADNVLYMSSVLSSIATDPECNLASLDKGYVPYIKLNQQF